MKENKSKENKVFYFMSGSVCFREEPRKKIREGGLRKKYVAVLTCFRRREKTSRRRREGEKRRFRKSSKQGVIK